MSKTNKPKMAKSKILVRLIKYLMEYKAWMLTAICITIAANLFALVGPYLSGLAIDSIGGKGLVDFLRFYTTAGLWLCSILPRQCYPIFYSEF